MGGGGGEWRRLCFQYTKTLVLEFVSGIRKSSAVPSAAEEAASWGLEGVDPGCGGWVAVSCGFRPLSELLVEGVVPSLS